jgi:serine/threonine protein kinase
MPFQAPEVYVGSHQHGTASEWFSAGITLHELLTGRRPFEATRLQAFRYCRGWASTGDADRYAEDPVSSCLPSARTVADALWPEFLFGQGSEGLSADCKSFVRALLIPDVSARRPPLFRPNT